MWTLVHIVTGIDAYLGIGNYPSKEAIRRIHGTGETNGALVVFNKKTQKLEGVPAAQKPNKTLGLVEHIMVGMVKDAAILLLFAASMRACDSLANAADAQDYKKDKTEKVMPANQNKMQDIARAYLINKTR